VFIPFPYKYRTISPRSSQVVKQITINPQQATAQEFLYSQTNMKLTAITVAFIAFIGGAAAVCKFRDLFVRVSLTLYR
jgi:hypothetical protein